MTIEEVARRAGVSVATVSRALRDLPNVAPGTRDRVRAVAAELRYSVDPYASRLATGRNDAVAVAVPRLSTWFFGSVAAGVEDGIADSGLDLIVYSVRDEAGRARLLHNSAGLARFDGLVLIDLVLDDAEVAHLVDEEIPVVTIGQRLEAFPSVRIDDTGATAELTRHLLELGHRRIALVGAEAKGELPFTVPYDRRIGYRRALREAGIEPDPALEIAAAFDPEGGRQVVHEALAADPRPTALLCLSDELAMGALVALGEAGIRVPEDLSVTGFDDHAASEALGLTTMRQDPRRLGLVAAGLLRERIDDPEAPPRHVVAQTHFVRRASTGHAPVKRKTAKS